MILTTCRRKINVLCFLFLLLWSFNFSSCKIIKIAFLAPSSSSDGITAGSSVDGLRLALRSILKNPNILSGHKIAAKFFDTRCEGQSAVTTAMQAKATYNPDVIVGPPCQEGLKMVAQLGTYWNLPVLSWYHTGNEFNSALKYPTLIRMIPPVHVLTKALVHLLKQRNWGHVTMMYTGKAPWALLEDPFRENAAAAGIEIHGVYKVTQNMSTTALKHMFVHIRHVAQAIVMVCPFEDTRHFILSAASVGMTNGEYEFIHLDPEIYTSADLSTKVLSKGSWQRGDVYDAQAKRAYQSVIQLMIDPMTERVGQQILAPRSMYKEYARIAQIENQFKHVEWELPPATVPDVYSAFLCDAVVVWGALVNTLISQGKDYRDGKLVAQYMKRVTTEGATGYIAINKDLDRLGEVFVLDMQDDGNFQPVQLFIFNKTGGASIQTINPTYQRFNNSLSTVQDHSGNPASTVMKHSHGHHGTDPIAAANSAPTIEPITDTLTTSMKATTITTTASTSTTSITTSTTSPDSVSAIQARLKALEAAIKLKNKQITETAHMQKATKPTAKPPVKGIPNRKIVRKIDPFLNNFEVRLKMKRRIYAKAKKFLDQIGQTEDPNVAAFLRIALRRLNADEELVPIKRPRYLRRKGITGEMKTRISKNNKLMTQNKRKVKMTTANIPVETTSPMSDILIPSTVPVPSYPTTHKQTKTTTQAQYVTDAPAINQPIKQPVQRITTVTTQRPIRITKPQTKQKTIALTKTTIHSTIQTTTTEIPLQTTDFFTTTTFFEETTTPQPTTQAPTTKKRIIKKKRKQNFRKKNNRKGKGKNKKSRTETRLRQTSLPPPIPTTTTPKPTTPSPTTQKPTTPKPTTPKQTTPTTTPKTTTPEPTDPPDLGEMLGSENMIMSIVNKVTNDMMGKVKGELQTLKKTIQTIKEQKMETTPQINVPYESVTEPTKLEVTPSTVPVDITYPTTDRSTTMNAKSNSEAEMRLALIEEIKANVLTKLSGVSWLGNKPKSNRMQSVANERNAIETLTSTIKPQTTTEKAVVEKQKSPKMVGSWNSVLPKDLSMKLFAMRTVPTKRERISNETQSNSKNKSQRTSRNNPFLIKEKTTTQTISTERPARKEDLFKIRQNGISTIESTDAVPVINAVKPNEVNMDSIIAKITNAVIGEVNKKIDVELVKPTTTTTTTTTTQKPVLSLRHKFESTGTSNRVIPVSSGDFVKQISEAVMMKLTGGLETKPEPPPKTTQAPSQVINTQSKNGGNLVDAIASKVFGKMNAKFDSLSKRVHKLQQDTGIASRQEMMEDMAAESYGRGPPPMMQPFGPMPGMPGMPPMGMFGMPYAVPNMGPKPNLKEQFNTGGSAGTKQSDTSNTPATNSSNSDTKPKTLTVTFDLKSMGNMPGMPFMNPWMNMGMQNQQQMWGPPRQTKSPWWE